MTVISHGNTIQKFTCETCNCVFQATESDYRVGNEVVARSPIGYGAYFTKIQWFSYLSCPECGTTIDKIMGDTETV